MADNIKIVGNIVNTQQVSRYDEQDTNLLVPQTIKEDFGQSNDYIEYFVYDIGGNLLNVDYTYQDFKLPNTSFVTPTGSLPVIEIDPVKDLQGLGYISGEYKVQYNFFNTKISDPNAGLFIKEISADRTEIRVGSTSLTNEQIESGSLALINESTGSLYFVDYLLNFGDNIQVVSVNTALNRVETGYEILFKLYQPLPDNIDLKSTLWVVSEKVSPYVFDINLDTLLIPEPLPQLRGPNFDIEIYDQNNVATSYQTYTNLIDSVQSISTSSYQQLLSLVTSQSININVDYTDYSNFSIFGSVEQRLKNFYDKVKNIQDLQYNITTYTALTASNPTLINDYNKATASVNNIISNFDGYEYFLYFESSSYTWPKTTSTLPYTLATTASAETWYATNTGSADAYDNNNPSYLAYAVPAFIKDDPNNNQYITFLNMIGHYFDNVWIFLQAVTDINLANNNLNKGVSKDLVYYVLQSLGVNLYNKYGDSNNVNFLIGQSGSAIFDNNFTATGSYLNTIPRKDLLAESYKRIYHNLPLLLKTKGTTYGLQTLISTFGITGSILSIKEYGGDTKSGLLNEYNDNKIRIVSVESTGSVLSPYTSIQLQPTSSTLFRTNDLHYVDISFSPQEKIDIFASASIAASASATWSLDDFIGDPRLQYSSSYIELDTQKTIYLSPLSASSIPYTGSTASGSIAATDYNSFIRLVQLFDNSLFKMIQDYVPARTSLSTGVTITSPILERNKWSYANPSKTSKIEVKEGTIDPIEIGTEYTELYNNLNGDKVAYYDGNLSGSYINVYSYFENSNINPYLIGTTASWNAQHSANESANYNKFLHSDFNVLLNNVSNSLVSINRQDIQFIYGTTQSILSPAELQDSYESLKTHQLSRYEGVKLSSATYNTYTDGDISYGKTAVIDRNTVKLGLFSEVVSNRFLPKRNNTILKYLVNINGDLTELNLRNTHWEEVQNMFVVGDTSSISQFNNQLYSNQKTTDGEKLIFDSGWTYSPILYFASCASDPNLSFQNQGNPSAYLAEAQNLSSSYFISGSSTNGYPLQGGYVLNLFNSLNNPATYWTSSTISTPATYSVQETGQYKVYANVQITTQMSASNNATWSLEMYKNNVKIQEVSQSLYFGGIEESCTETHITNEGSDDVNVQYLQCVDGAPRTLLIKPGSTRIICARSYEIVSGDLWTDIPSGSCGTYIIGGDTTQTTTLTINNGYSGNSNYSSFTIGEKVAFKLRLVNASSNNITASLATGNNGFVSIGSLALSTGYSVASICPYTLNSSDSSFSFNTQISSFYGSQYFFSPNPTSGSVSTLYDEYGDVDYAFNPKPYDLLILYLSDDTILEYTVLNVSIVGGQLSLTLDAPLSNLAKTDLAAGSYKRFLLLSRIKDETNVILNFTKRDGKTSYGFLIPEDISQSVLDNIDTITREVKQKLLNDQSVISEINGGTFGP